MSEIMEKGKKLNLLKMLFEEKALQKGRVNTKGKK